MEISGAAADLKAKANGRTRQVVEKVNTVLSEIALDFDAEAAVRTPAGNVTERHICSAYREMAELANRMDIELHSSLFIAHGRAANNSGDYFGLLTETDVSNNISELLQQDYDCIFLAGVSLDKLTPGQRSEILRKVENGCGLVLVGCSGKNKDILI